MRNFHFPGRSQVYSSNAMVATSQPLASETALNTLKNGGSFPGLAALAAFAARSATPPFFSLTDSTRGCTGAADDEEDEASNRCRTPPRGPTAADTVPDTTSSASGAPIAS